jgi:hypothetical protein
MTLQLLNTLATLGTFVVIAATAIVAVIQLRHARSSNQIAALNELRETMDSPEFAKSQHFVLTDLAKKMEDPAFRYQLANRSERTTENQRLITGIVNVGNLYENMGVLVKTGLVDRSRALELWWNVTSMAWEALEPCIAIFRRNQGDTIYENFEYLTLLSREWILAHPGGTYPRGVNRIDVRDPWLAADEEYAASLARASIETVDVIAIDVK